MSGFAQEALTALAEDNDVPFADDDDLGSDEGRELVAHELVPVARAMTSASGALRVHLFGPFRLEVDERRLWRDGKRVPLTGKAFDTLRLLVEGAGRLQTQTSLIDRLWPDVAVEQNNLQYNISLVRRALAEASGVEIETVRGQGYRLLTDVQPPPPEPNATHHRSAPKSPRVRSCAPKDGARLTRSIDIDINVPGALGRRVTLHLGEGGINLSVELASGDILSRELPATASAMNIVVGEGTSGPDVDMRFVQASGTMMARSTLVARRTRSTSRPSAPKQRRATSTLSKR